MENNSSSSHPDSHESSPPSREGDCENGSAASWDDQSAPPAGGVGSGGGGGSFRVKFMCSYGGKIEPRPHDNQLSYFGGETKILAVDRSARFSVVLSKLSSLCGNGDLTFFKYQLPGEDLDALISVTNDEDLEHMMMEYDRVHRSSPKPARLRLFLFLPSSAAATTGGAALPPKPDREWFIDALNSVPPLPPAAASPAAEATPNPDFLFGFDKAEAKEPVVAEVARAEIPVPDRARDDRTVLAGGGGGGGGGEGVAVSSAEIQRQIQELQRLQILGNQEQAAFLQGKTDEAADHYLPPKIPENPSPLPPAAVTQVPATYWQDRFPVVTGGGYASMAGTDQPMLLIPVPAARPINGGPGQGYYVYREQQPQMYGTAAPKLSPHCTGTTEINGGRKAAAAAVTDNGGGFAHVAYHGAGRPVYYMAAPVVSTYQTVVTATPEGKKTPQAS